MTRQTRRDPHHSRRGFLRTTACSGACLLTASLARSAAEEGATAETPPPLPDFEKLTYCCYQCTEQCPFLKATLTDDRAAKQQLAARWQAKYGRSFSPEEVSCFGCKVPVEKQGYAVSHCTVRRCVEERKLVSCAHCRELASCQKDLWRDYPDFRQRVLAIQKQLLG